MSQGGAMVPGQVNGTIATARSGSGISALRIADTWNVDVNAGVSGFTAAGNGGDATTQVDFFDVNGDRFPDSITSGGVQFNDGTGTFSARQAVNAGFGDLRRTVNASLQAGLSVSSSDRQLINETDGEGNTKRLSSTSSLSGSVDYGVSSTRVDFADVNGDGLPDHIRQDNATNLTVKLNLGYGFSNEVVWAAPANWSQGRTSVTIAKIGATDVGAAVNTFIPGTPNTTNSVRWGNPTTGYSVATGNTFGQITGTNGSQRQIRFCGRLVF